MKAVHTTKLWKALKNVLPYPAFLTVPALIVSVLVSCVTTVDANPVFQPSLYLFCIKDLCTLYHPLLSIPQRDQGSPSRHRFSIFFSSYTALFSSGLALPGNGFQRIHSKFPIFNIRFSSLGNTRSLPTQSLGIDCTSRLASHSEGTITLMSQAVVSSWQVTRNNRMILPLALP